MDGLVSPTLPNSILVAVGSYPSFLLKGAREDTYVRDKRRKIKFYATVNWLLSKLSIPIPSIPVFSLWRYEQLPRIISQGCLRIYLDMRYRNQKSF
jgi:hypothetical protein